MKKFILSFTCFIVSLFLFVPLNAHAYTSQDDLYPLNIDGYVFFKDLSNNQIYSANITPTNNVYSLNNSFTNNIRQIGIILNEPFVFPYNDQYDYYLLGSIYSYVSSPDTVSTFFPRQVAVHYHDYNSSTNLFTIC